MRALRWEHFDPCRKIVRLHGTKSAAALRPDDLPAWLVARRRARTETITARHGQAALHAKHSDTESRAKVMQRPVRVAEGTGRSKFVFAARGTFDPELP